MTATARFPGFYRGAINLWVEDTLTRDYPRKVWPDDPAVVFYVGGGNEGVSAVLREAEIAGLTNVFAFIDRDFGLTNRPSWNNAVASRRLVSSVHEVENHILDVDALAGCSLNTGGKNAADIEARMRQRATELAWWMACRCVIAEARRTTLSDFPAHPTCPPVVDQPTAEGYLLALPWWGDIQAFAPSLTNPNLQTRLVAHHAVAAGWIANGQWVAEFPGKELFRARSGLGLSESPSRRVPCLARRGSRKGCWRVASSQ